MVKPISHINDLPALLEERRLVNRLREAVQSCKTETNLEHWYNDQKMPAEDRMKIERCLTQNYLLKFGLDYFGKRDLIYIDMKGDRDVARLYSTEP
jgi:hypothetical protein